MSINQTVIFRAILVIVAAVIIFVGLNVAFGGIRTMGWQVSPDFVTVADERKFAVQDSHVRFLGGFFGAAGVIMLLASTNIDKYQAELRLIFVLMFVAGLARLTAMQPDVILGANVITSFAAEVILMPILFLWLPRITAKEES